MTADHTWRTCIPLLAANGRTDPDSPTNRKIRKVIQALPEIDRINLHRANCENRIGPVQLAAVKKVRAKLRAAGIGEVPEEMTAVVLLTPVDIAANFPGPPDMNPVSIDHSMTTCDRCNGNSWIGPQQFELVKAGQATKVCYRCAATDPELATASPLVTNPDIDDRPRRY